MENRARNKKIRKRLVAVGYFAGVISTLTVTIILLVILNVVYNPKQVSIPLNEEKSTLQPSDSFIAAQTQYPKAEGLLQLVNFNNPTGDERPHNLVSIRLVIGDEAVIRSYDMSINQEAVIRSYDMSINQEAGIQLSKMCKEALRAGLDRYIINSAYRSVEEQKTLWENRLKTDPDYGKDPYKNPVKVMPGNMSEHATGLAIDLLNMSHTSANDAYGESEAGIWLSENAHKFGFIIRYPKDKQYITGVIYEPWHIRYVGKEAAEEIYNRGICLEEYLGEV